MVLFLFLFIFHHTTASSFSISRSRNVERTILIRRYTSIYIPATLHRIKYPNIVDSLSYQNNFSVSPLFHFVKESSLKRVGVKWDRQSAAVAAVGQRPNWLMAVTTRLELCKIRKTDNRLVYLSLLLHGFVILK